jgi:hypothetical protein
MSSAIGRPEIGRLAATYCRSCRKTGLLGARLTAAHVIAIIIFYLSDTAGIAVGAKLRMEPGVCAGRWLEPIQL